MPDQIPELARLRQPDDAALDLVDQLYAGMLRRAPDAHGRAAYARMLSSGTPVADVLTAMMQSEEFESMRLVRDTAQPPPSVVAISGGSKGARWPVHHAAAGESGRAYAERRKIGFFDAFCSGELVLDVGFAGYQEGLRPCIPGAIGIDLDYPGYDGLVLPFGNGTVDSVYSSHALEHIPFPEAVIRDWHRVCKVGGFIVCMVPHQHLYEKRRFPPSRFNDDHRRFYTPAGLLKEFEEALDPNSYRVRHLRDNDLDFDYTVGPQEHAVGGYEIELAVEKIEPPKWEIE